MKILLLGDVHLKAKKLKDVASAWKRMVEKATSLGCEHILQAGDVFDHANVFGKEATVGTIYDAFLSPFIGSSIRYTGIIGNHDIGGPDNKDALVPIDHHAWMTVYRTPSHICLEDQVGLVMLPWIDRATLMRSMARKGLSPEESRQKIEALLSGKLLDMLKGYVAEYKAKGKPVIFMSHLEITGAQMDSGRPQCGGMFEFSPSALSGIGADVYALGHIHKRQKIIGLPGDNDGYLGAICQSKFGEEDNATGGRFIEFSKSGQIVHDEWVTDSASPRYFTVGKLTDASPRDIDYVKLRSDHRPEDLPAGVIFEKLPVKREAPKDGDDVFLDADSPLNQLLEEWGKRANTTITKELMEVAKALKSSPSHHGIGSWESLDKIILNNITCHTNTTINLDGIRGVIGIEGPNGSGKTTALEAIVFSLYGESPRHSPQELLSTFSLSAGLTEIHFTSSGKKYIARRELKAGKTLSHKAFMFEGEDNPIAGPNVSAVNDSASVIVGDKDLVMAGVFAAQQDSGNMVELLPAQRKELFAKLIGSEKFLEMSEQARLDAKAEAVLIKATEDRIAEIKANILDYKELVKELESIREKKEAKGKELDEEKEKLDEIIKSLQNGKDRETQRIGINSQIAELERKKNAIEAEAKTLKAEWQELVKVDLKKAEEELSDAKKLLDEAITAKEEASKIAQEKSALSSKASETRAKASSMKADRMSAYNSKLKEVEQKQKEVRASRAEQYQKMQTKLQELKNAVSVLESEISESCRKVELIKGFPDLPPCQTCVLSEDCVKAKNGLPSKREELDKTKARIAKGEKMLADYAKATEDMVAQVACPDEDSFQPEVLTEIKKLIEEAEAIEKLAKGKVVPQALVEIINDHENRTKAVKDAETALSAAKNASSRIETIKALLGNMRSSHKEIMEEIKALRDGMPQAVDMISLKSAWNELTNSIKELSDELLQISVDLGKQESKIEENERRKDELKKLVDSIDPKKLVIQNLSTLASAFGRDGIPQMLVERTIPRFEEVMNELVAEFECGIEIKVISQKQTKKGSTEDVIEILVNDGHSWREIRTYSGGENKFLKYMVRIAFAIVQAERSGKGLKVLVLDEAMDALDDDKTNDFMSMIMKLPKYFNQVFIISHNARIISDIPCRIKFERVSLAHPCTVTMSTPGS